jgi:hypothetical protein
MTILCCGDRNWKHYYVIYARLSEYRGQDVTIIHGNASGADRMSAKVAVDLGLSVKSFQAEWEKFGKAAGPIRNSRMLAEGNPDLVIAFHDDIRNSKGTKDMVDKAKRKKITTEVISST